MTFEERESQLSFGPCLLTGRSTILQGMLSDLSVHGLYDVNSGDEGMTLKDSVVNMINIHSMCV